MKRLALLLVLVVSHAAFAQDASVADGGLDAGFDAGASDASVVDSGVADAGTVSVALAHGAVLTGVPQPAAELDHDTIPALDSPLPFLKVVFLNVKNGNWFGAAAALLVLVVSLLRLYGKKAHAFLSDKKSALDVPFKFFFETKPGGWLLNFVTAVAGGMGTALLASEPITWALLKPIVEVSVTGSALWELLKDVWQWIQSKKVPAAPPSP